MIRTSVNLQRLNCLILEKRRDEEWDVILDGCLDDPDADRSRCIVELRAGTGGDEAALFVRDLFEMYRRYATEIGWTVEVMDASPTELGGFQRTCDWGVRRRGVSTTAV